MLTMYHMQSHPDRHERGRICGELDVETEDVNASLETHVSVINIPADPDAEYCDGTQMLPRVAVNATLSTTSGLMGDTVILTGLPDPCMLYVNGIAVEATGGSYVHTLDYVGDHLIETNEATFLPTSWVIGCGA